ncbi:MAG: hypothetical protein NT040_08910, partial [Bacteroidetes bacterium]|nr:hypothetical protein [Bacteroidota bacterium]
PLEGRGTDCHTWGFWCYIGLVIEGIKKGLNAANQYLSTINVSLPSNGRVGEGAFQTLHSKGRAREGTFGYEEQHLVGKLSTLHNG